MRFQKFQKWIAIGIVIFMLAGIVMGAVFFAVDAVRSVEEEPPLEEPPLYMQVPILMYHHLDADEANTNDMTITPQKFREDMEAIQRLGFTTVTFQDVIDFVAGNRILPQNPIIVTFDDGYYSNYR